MIPFDQFQIESTWKAAYVSYVYILIKITKTKNLKETILFYRAYPVSCEVNCTVFTKYGDSQRNNGTYSFCSSSPEVTRKRGLALLSDTTVDGLSIDIKMSVQMIE